MVQDRNLVYKPAPASIKRTGKGFVYKLLVNCASNTLFVWFQNFCQRLNNEYIIVQDKKHVVKSQTYNVIPHIFNVTYQGYIMRGREPSEVCPDDILSSEDKTCVIALVSEAVQKGHIIKDITNFLQSYIDNNKKGKHNFLFKISDCMICI